MMNMVDIIRLIATNISKHLSSYKSFSYYSRTQHLFVSKRDYNLFSQIAQKITQNIIILFHWIRKYYDIFMLMFVFFYSKFLIFFISN